MTLVAFDSRRRTDGAFLAMAGRLGAGPRSNAEPPPPVARPCPWPVAAAFLAVVPAVLALFVGIGARNAASAAAGVCTPVTYATEGLAPGTTLAADVDEAISELTAVSGVRFEAITGGAAQVTLRWIPGPAFRRVTPSAAWLGYAAAVVATRPDALRGHLVFDADAPLLPGAGPGSWGALVRHELGHLLGLGHSTDPQDLMYARVDLGPGRWSPAETAHLRMLGTAMGCDPADAAGA